MEDLERQYEEKHVKNMLAISQQIKKLYSHMVQTFSRLASGYIYHDSDIQRIKTWYRNEAMKKEIDQYLKKFSRELEALIRKQLEISWSLAENKQDSILKKILKGLGIIKGGKILYDLFNRMRPVIPPAKGLATTVKIIVSVDDVLAAPRRLEAMTAFIDRTVKGLKLSERVWKLAEGNLHMVEELLSNGLLEGKSAAEISITLNQYLQDPSIMFRRVRDRATGELRMSATAKAYHPGKGVYRSSYANARRLAVTETNMAYRRADYERRLLNPSVVGFEIKLSKQHPVTDVCNDLVGRYPKEFIFTGFHPLCLCHTTSIMLSPEEFAKFQQSILDGTDSTFDLTSVNTVNQVPDGFNDWVDQNKDRAKGWSSLPYFLQENAQYAPALKDLF